MPVIPVINPIYVSASCNSAPNCCDINKDNVACYGSCNSVVVHNIINKEDVKRTLSGHSDHVNCVKWVEVAANTEPYIVSCSSDKSIILWKSRANQYEIGLKVSCHDGPVTYLDVLFVSPCLVYIATTSADCTTKVWKATIDKQQPAVELLTTLKMRNQLALSLALYKLPRTSEVMLACGTEDQKVHLFIEKNSEFEEVMLLRGHSEWIRGLEFIQLDGKSLLLASASQDSHIRIWKISVKEGDEPGDVDANDDEDDEDHCTSDRAYGGGGGDDDDDCITLTSNLFSSRTCSLKFTVTLESVLSGHENWVYSVHWNKSADDGSGCTLRLISSSMDKTIIVWKVDASTGLWMEEIRVGEVGGNNLGFYGARMTCKGGHILGHSFRGAFHLWSPSQTSPTMEPSTIWGGHFSSVNDLCWGRGGGYLLSVSTDQTTRLHAKWNNQIWCEVARPQVHGYDIKCVCPIDRFRFASGADEKIVRVFSAPRNFLYNFSHLCHIQLSQEELTSNSTEGACVPALGLSNKPVSEQQQDLSQHSQKRQQYSENYFVPQIYKNPPTEDNLMQNTLWPEEHKFYGHGYELFAIDCSPDGRVVASACKATKLEHASIIIWEVGAWKQVCTLQHHTLTITQLTFSHQGHLLLSVSRDRTWALYARHQDGLMYSKVCNSTKDTCIHARIIWTCSWFFDDRYFVTGSRDKKVVVWKVDSCDKNTTSTDLNTTMEFKVNHTPFILELQDSITAIDVAPQLINDKYLMSMGLESGNILFYLWSSGCHDNIATWVCLQSLNNSVAHHKTVKRLRFRPMSSSSSSSSSFEMASCSEDGSVKIFEITFT